MDLQGGLIGLIILIIVLVIYVPITNELIPTMVSSMGATTGLMVELTILAILMGGIFLFIRQVTGYGDDQHANIQ